MPRYQHGGADVAHRPILMVFPGINAAVVTQINSAVYNFGITNQITDLFLEKYLESEKLSEEPENELFGPRVQKDFNYETEKF